MRLNAHVAFDGGCREAFELYERSLGGKILTMLTYGDSPMAEQVPAEWRSKISRDAHRRQHRFVRRRCDAGAGVPSTARFSPGLRDRRSSRGGMDLCGFVRGRERANAAAEDVLGGAVRHGDGPVRRVVGDQLRAARAFGDRSRAVLSPWIWAGDTEGTGQVREALQNIVRLVARGRHRWPAGLKELVIGVLVVNVGLALADVVQGDRAERNRSQLFPEIRRTQRRFPS